MVTLVIIMVITILLDPDHFLAIMVTLGIIAEIIPAEPLLKITPLTIHNLYKAGKSNKNQAFFGGQ